MDPNPNAALYAALAVAQSQFKPIRKNREVQIQMKSGGKFKFRYADIDEINNATREALSSNGLSLIQPVKSEAGGVHWIETTLTHSSGATIESRMEVKSPAVYADPKEFGAAVTYLRRYALSALLGIAADDDLDEDGRPTGSGGTDPSDAEKARISTLTEDLCKRVGATKTEEDALAFWRSESKKLSEYPNAYDELRGAYMTQVRSLRAAKKQTQGATA